MKKIISALAACVLILCLVGCADKGTVTPEEAATGLVVAIYEQRAKEAAEFLYQGTKDIMAGKENASNGDVAKRIEEAMAESDAVTLKQAKAAGVTIIDKKSDISGGLDELYAVSGVKLDAKAVDAVATVEIEISGYIGETLETNTIPVYCAKINGEWFVVYFE